MELRFVVADENGISDFTEIEILSLWPEQAYRDALADAGCSVRYVPGGPTGRDLFVGVRS